MKPLIGYTDPFLSPVTGKLTGMQQLPDLTFGHVWMGDELNRPIETYKLIDLSIDVKTLQDQVAHPTLEYQHVWVGNRFHKAEPVRYLPLENLPVLGAALFPYPSSMALPAIPMPNPTFNPASGFDWLMSGPWLPQIYAGSTNTLNTQSNTSISSSLAMTQINVAQAIKRFFHAKLIVKTKAVDFTWDNPAMGTIPQTIKDLYGLNTHYDLTNAIALDELGQGLLWNAEGGELQLAKLKHNHVWVGDENDKPVESAFAPLPNLTTGKTWVGNADNRPEEQFVASHNATYILQQPADNLTNAQAINALTRNSLLKSSLLGTGAIEAATAGVDYPTVDSVTQAQATADSAQIAAAAAQATADSAFGLATGAAATAGAAMAGVTALGLEKESKSDHKADMDAVNRRIDNIHGEAKQITVDHADQSNIRIALADNTVFSGQQGIVITRGTTGERPQVPVAGTFRFNTDL